LRDRCRDDPGRGRAAFGGSARPISVSRAGNASAHATPHFWRGARREQAARRRVFDECDGAERLHGGEARGLQRRRRQRSHRVGPTGRARRRRCAKTSLTLNELRTKATLLGGAGSHLVRVLQVRRHRRGCEEVQGHDAAGRDADVSSARAVVAERREHAGGAARDLATRGVGHLELVERVQDALHVLRRHLRDAACPISTG
jgi:hypothetical protein